MYKLFEQEKDKYTNRYVASKLVEEFIVLYKLYRFTPTEDTFNKGYIVIDKSAKYSELDYY